MPLFIHPLEEEITPEVVSVFIKLHQAELKRYERLWKMYEGDAPILSNPKKPEHKPDNRLVVNFSKYLVDTFNGYFIGIPVKISHDNSEINERIETFLNSNDMDDNFSELAKISSIFGHGFEFLYRDEQANDCCTYNNPMDMFIVYDDTIAQRPLFGVHYRKTDKGIVGHLYDTAYKTRLTEGKDGLIFVEPEEHYYKGVPIIEYYDNEERKSVIEIVETLINAFDKGLSEKANDVDYFADAYLAILGAELDQDGVATVRDNRIINLFGTDNAKDILVQFLEKPDGDATQEHLLDRIERLIYQISMVANINDESFGNASGVALEFKLQPMKNLAKTKERKFASGMNRRHQLLFTSPIFVTEGQREEWRNLRYTFTPNMPRNIKDEIDTAKNAQGILSKETQLSIISVVDNVQDEMDRIAEEESMDPYKVGEDIELLGKASGAVNNETN